MRRLSTLSSYVFKSRSDFPESIQTRLRFGIVAISPTTFRSDRLSCFESFTRQTIFSQKMARLNGRRSPINPTMPMSLAGTSSMGITAALACSRSVTRAGALLSVSSRTIREEIRSSTFSSRANSARRNSNCSDCPLDSAVSISILS